MSTETAAPPAKDGAAGFMKIFEQFATYCRYCPGGGTFGYDG
jgi:hypothetical protein